MSSLHKKILFWFGLVLVVLFLNIPPQEGKTITLQDEIGTPMPSSSAPLTQRQAAATPAPESLNSEIRVGVFNEQIVANRAQLLPFDGSLSASADAFTSPFAQQTAVVPPDITASIALVSDLESGTHYLEKDIQRHWPIASITKLMTAVVANQTLSSSTVIEMTAEHFPTSEGSTTASLRPGDQFTVRDLIQIMVIASDNAAAEALAQTYGRDAFLAKMNDQARLWGMNHTYFYDPSGLSPINQSSIEDLEKMAFQLYSSRENILKIARQPGVKVIEQASRRTRSIRPINIFSGRSDFIGGKTGFTDEAGGNLLSIFSVARRPVLIIVMHSQGRFDDTTTLLNWFKDNYE